tara:strand:- start:1014 stop:1346 length:333 start_codon:yes stop_codon:yes gene_type:complete
MTYLTGEVSVIHNETQVNFSGFVYSAVYCNAATCSATLNGTVVNMVAGDTLEVIVNGNTTVVAGSDMLFLGNPKPAYLFNTGLISGTTQTYPNPEVYRFVDIKSGLPTDG